VPLPTILPGIKNPALETKGTAKLKNTKDIKMALRKFDFTLL
jgi:hypothetical protein